MRSFCLLLALVLSTPALHAQSPPRTGAGGSGVFQGLGDLPGGDFYSQAYGVSADGSVVVGVGTKRRG